MSDINSSTKKEQLMFTDQAAQKLKVGFVTALPKARTFKTLGSNTNKNYNIAV
jgi:hypothetical protein